MIDEKRFSKPAGKDAVQNVILENRKKLSISGTEDVESFDEETIVLYTELGVLTVKGEGLHLNKLSIESGEVAIEGDIISITYSDGDASSRGMGLFGKLFR